MPGRPRLLDLFCGAGGASMGYHRAGFDVVGVDINPQPHYPFEFHWADALTFPLDGFDVIHASPPCQHHSALAALWPDRRWPNLIPPTQERLGAWGGPYVIENVERAPLAQHPGLFGVHGIVLCGSMFGLGWNGYYLKRHRAFESNVNLAQPPCRHRGLAVSVVGHGGGSDKTMNRHRVPSDMATRAGLLGIDWPMTRDEQAEAIPPAYTHWIGQQLLAELPGAEMGTADSPRADPRRQESSQRRP